MGDRIRVVIADHYPIVVEGLRALIQTTLDIVIVGEAMDCLEVVQIAKVAEPDVILLDVKMPCTNTVDLITEIQVELFISERTVRTHVSNILSNLDLENRTQATLFALRMGWIDLQSITSRGFPAKDRDI